MHNYISTGALRSQQNSGVSEGDFLGPVEKGAAQRGRLTGANKRMLNLLRKAKVQLIKIDQQKHLKSSGVTSLSPQRHVLSFTILMFITMKLELSLKHTVLNDVGW